MKIVNKGFGWILAVGIFCICVSSVFCAKALEISEENLKLSERYKAPLKVCNNEKSDKVLYHVPFEVDDIHAQEYIITKGGAVYWHCVCIDPNDGCYTFSRFLNAEDLEKVQKAAENKSDFNDRYVYNVLTHK